MKSWKEISLFLQQHVYLFLIKTVHWAGPIYMCDVLFLIKVSLFFTLREVFMHQRVPAVQAICSIDLIWPIPKHLCKARACSPTFRQLYCQILSCYFFHAQWNTDSRTQIIITETWLLRLPPNVMQQRGWGGSQQLLLWEGPCTSRCCQSCGKALAVRPGNRAMQWKRPKSLSVLYLKLLLAFKDLTLLLQFLLWFGFAPSTSSMELSQPKARFKVFARVTTAKSGGRLMRHGLGLPQGSARSKGCGAAPQMCFATVNWLWVRFPHHKSSCASCMRLAGSIFSSCP